MQRVMWGGSARVFDIRCPLQMEEDVQWFAMHVLAVNEPNGRDRESEREKQKCRGRYVSSVSAGRAKIRRE